MSSSNAGMKYLGIVAAAAVIAAKIAAAQDPVALAPGNYKTLLENDRVRVLDIHLAPGESVPMHAHPASVIYHVCASKEKHTFGDGKTDEHEFKAGDVAFSEVFTHAAENTGESEAHVLVVELKAAGPSGTAPLPADRDPTVTAAAQYKAIFENDRVRMLEIRAAPGARIPMHSHPATVIYHVGPSKEKHAFLDGKIDEREFKGGEAAFTEAFSHSAENIGKSELHVLAVELK